MVGHMYLSFRLPTSEKEYIINTGFSLNNTAGVQIRAADGDGEAEEFADEVNQYRFGVDKCGNVKDIVHFAYMNGFSDHSDSSSDDESPDLVDKSLTFSEKNQAIKVDYTTKKYTTNQQVRGHFHFKISPNV